MLDADTGPYQGKMTSLDGARVGVVDAQPETTRPI
jgi:hypothetical protein